jgi:hypothetical protein
MAFFEKTEHQLAFTIEDNGIGFDSEDAMARLFAGGEVKGFNSYPLTPPPVWILPGKHSTIFILDHLPFPFYNLLIPLKALSYRGLIFS